MTAADGPEGSRRQRRLDYRRLLREQLARTQTIRRVHALDTDPPEGLQALRDWQGRRLAATHRDFMDHPRYREAARFFLNDLYGPHDIKSWDDAIERIYPLMVRLLPQRLIHTVALAFELQALTHELDLALLEALRAMDADLSSIDEQHYCQAYRRSGDRRQRRRQIELVAMIGRDLEEAVHMPMVYRTLCWARGPAYLWGLGDLQSFLERGFRAFRDMGSASAFIDSVVERETRIMDNIFDGAERPLEHGIN